jgi:hypothetical protein
LLGIIANVGTEYSSGVDIVRPNGPGSQPEAREAPGEKTDRGKRGMGEKGEEEVKRNDECERE